MERKELLYTGKAKKMYATDQENVLWAEYLNQATALNGVKKDTIEGKGRLNNQITAASSNIWLKRVSRAITSKNCQKPNNQ